MELAAIDNPDGTVWLMMHFFLTSLNSPFCSRFLLTYSKTLIMLPVVLWFAIDKVRTTDKLLDREKMMAVEFVWALTSRTKANIGVENILRVSSDVDIEKIMQEVREDNQGQNLGDLGKLVYNSLMRIFAETASHDVFEQTEENLK